MRKFLLALVAVVAFTVVSRTLIVCAQEMAQEPVEHTQEMAEEMTESMNEMSDMTNEVSNEMLNEMAEMVDEAMLEGENVEVPMDEAAK